jgi:hypothetical protein
MGLTVVPQGLGENLPFLSPKTVAGKERRFAGPIGVGWGE